MKRTGVYLYASPRIGKTVCAEQVQALLLLEFPRLHIMRISARRSLRPSDAHLFRLLLDSVNHVLSKRTSVDLLFQTEEHTSELQSLMRISYAVFCLTQKIRTIHYKTNRDYH